jgi:hypothetical protein
MNRHNPIHRVGDRREPVQRGQRFGRRRGIAQQLPVSPDDRSFQGAITSKALVGQRGIELDDRLAGVGLPALCVRVEPLPEPPSHGRQVAPVKGQVEKPLVGDPKLTGELRLVEGGGSYQRGHHPGPVQWALKRVVLVILYALPQARVDLGRQPCRAGQIVAQHQLDQLAKLDAALQVDNRVVIGQIHVAGLRDRVAQH